MRNGLLNVAGDLETLLPACLSMPRLEESSVDSLFSFYHTDGTPRLEVPSPGVPVSASCPALLLRLMVSVPAAALRFEVASPVGISASLSLSTKGSSGCSPQVDTDPFAVATVSTLVPTSSGLACPWRLPCSMPFLWQTLLAQISSRSSGPVHTSWSLPVGLGQTCRNVKRATPKTTASKAKAKAAPSKGRRFGLTGVAHS